MRDQQRIDQMNEGAAYLRGLPTDRALTSDEVGRLANMALGMEKVATFILDRDAGPNLEAKAEILRLTDELSAGNEVAKAIDKDFLDFREKTKPMRQQNDNMKTQLTGKQQEIEDLKKEVMVVQGKLDKALSDLATAESRLEGVQDDIKNGR